MPCGVFRCTLVYFGVYTDRSALVVWTQILLLEKQGHSKNNHVYNTRV